MFVLFIFGCMEIRAEDCLTVIGYPDLGACWIFLDGSWTWNLFYLFSGLVFSTLWTTVILIVSYCIMLVMLRIVLLVGMYCGHVVGYDE